MANDNIKHTELWEIKPDGKRYLMNTISHGSRFQGFPTPKEMWSPEGQLEAARNLKLGWTLNGSGRGLKYEIIQVWLNGRTCVVN